jgi:hypothetical protein
MATGLSGSAGGWGGGGLELLVVARVLSALGVLILRGTRKLAPMPPTQPAGGTTPGGDLRGGVRGAVVPLLHKPCRELAGVGLLCPWTMS